MRLLIITQKVDRDDDVLGFFCYWISNIAKYFTEVVVIALCVGRHDLPSNVRVYSLGKENKSNKLTQALRFYVYLFRFIFKTDGIFVHMAPEYVRAIWPINIFLRRPVIMWYAHIKVSPVAKWAMSKVDRIFSPSKESFSITGSKFVSTGHGIDTELFKPGVHKKNKRHSILAISRISRVKRIEILIKAAKVLKDSYPDLDFEINIAGDEARTEDGRYRSELLDLVKTLGVNKKIKWLGGVKNSETPGLYNAADLFVRLQGGGGFGKTELEAMACGTPILVSTPVYKNFLGEFAEDTFFYEDDSHMCAEKIANILNWSESKKSKYSQISRKLVVDNHNIEKLAKRIYYEFNKIQ